MPQIRVCNISEEGRFGGPTRRMVLVARALKELGVETHIVYPKLDSEKLASELQHAGISCSCLDITRLSRERRMFNRYARRFIFETYLLSNFFRRHRFDLIHVNGSYQYKVAIAARLSGVPFVWHLNDTSMDRIVKAICTYLAKHCSSGVILAGSRVYDYYVKGTPLERKPRCEIEAPVDTRIFDPGITAPDRRTSEAPGRKIMTVSGMDPGKGLEYFIRMAADLQRRYADLSFFVAGAELSSQRKYFQHLVEMTSSCGLADRNFFFAGLVDNVPSFLKSSDIFVFTSNSEASPSAVWEAMSMGRAIVTTDVGSVSRYIENGRSGFVVPIKDVAALTERVELLLCDSALREKMGAEARIIAQKYFDVSVAARKHASFYRQVLASGMNGKPQEISAL
jgi:glycosyltransferase involved in cell wall biosynthesis